MSVHELLLVIASITGGVVAGGQLFVLVAIVPVKNGWPPRLAQQVHRDLLGDAADHFLRPLLGVTFVVAIAALAVHHALDDVTGIANLVALLGCLGVMVVSFRVQFPINHQVAQMPLDGPEDAYTPLGARWNRGHAIRTTSGTLAFVLLVIALCYA
jgi:Domain of unknown function (DUF1772)